MCKLHLIAEIFPKCFEPNQDSIGPMNMEEPFNRVSQCQGASRVLGICSEARKRKWECEPVAIGETKYIQSLRLCETCWAENTDWPEEIRPGSELYDHKAATEFHVERRLRAASPARKRSSIKPFYQKSPDKIPVWFDKNKISGTPAEGEAFRLYELIAEDHALKNVHDVAQAAASCRVACERNGINLSYKALIDQAGVGMTMPELRDVCKRVTGLVEERKWESTLKKARNNHGGWAERRRKVSTGTPYGKLDCKRVRSEPSSRKGSRTCRVEKFGRSV